MARLGAFLWLSVCLSTPVRCSNGRVVASFAMYDNPRDLKPARPEIIQITTHLASIAIGRAKVMEFRDHVEDELRENQVWLQVILESAKEFAIITLDHEGSITSWNAGAQRLMGYEDAEVLGQPGHISSPLKTACARSGTGDGGCGEIGRALATPIFSAKQLTDCPPVCWKRFC